MMHKYKLLQYIQFGAVLLLLVGSILTFFSFSRQNERQTTSSKASETKPNLKIMTYNVTNHSEELNKGKSGIEGEMKTLAAYIKEQNIDIIAFQELNVTKDDDRSTWDDMDFLSNELNRLGYPMEVQKRRIHKDDRASLEVQVWHAYFYRTSVGLSLDNYTHKSSKYGINNEPGYDILVLNTPYGKVRFINVHPTPHLDVALGSVDELLEIVNGFRSDNIPMILLGDFNLNYIERERIPGLQKIERAGFIRGCDPALFNNPRGNCNESPPLDHIYIDVRAPFRPVDGYAEKSRRDSHHLPVVVTVGNALPQLQLYKGSNGQYLEVFVPGKSCGEGVRGQVIVYSVPNHEQLGYLKDFAPNTDPNFYCDTRPYDMTGSTGGVGAYLRYSGTLQEFRAKNLPQVIYVKIPDKTKASAAIDLGPLASPTKRPTATPTRTPTPTKRPTMTPTRTPTPTTRPTMTPTRTPTVTMRPTMTPSRAPTQRPTFTSVPFTPVPNCPKRAMGDGNCDGVVDTRDYACWRIRFLTGEETDNCKNTDFNGKEAVNLLDFTIWKNSFVR